MNRLAVFGAVAVLALGGAAIAQTPPPADAPSADAVTAPPEATVPEAGDAAPMRPDRPMRPGMGMGPGRPGMGMMRPGGPMMAPPLAELQLPDTKGAVFVFESPHRGRVVIKCADADSTQSCAEAVKPLLDTMTAQRGPGMGPGMGMGRGPGSGPCMGQGAGPGQGMGRGPCGGGMGPGGPGTPSQAE